MKIKKITQVPVDDIDGINSLLSEGYVLHSFSEGVEGEDMYVRSESYVNMIKYCDEGVRLVGSRLSNEDSAVMVDALNGERASLMEYAITHCPMGCEKIKIMSDRLNTIDVMLEKLGETIGGVSYESK